MTPHRKARLILDNAYGQLLALRLPSNDPIMVATRQAQQVATTAVAREK